LTGIPSLPIDPADFSRPGTRRIVSFAAAAGAPVVAGAGLDGHVYIWNVGPRESLRDFPIVARAAEYLSRYGSLL
jgi:hypothetical protein